MAKYVIESHFIGPIAQIMATCAVTLECRRREAILFNMIGCFCTDHSKDLSKRGQLGILLYFP